MNGRARKLLGKISARTGINIKTLKTRWKRLTSKERGEARKWCAKDKGFAHLLNEGR
ncbi:hypothetical protein IIA15_00240 [candidate division TA06 bacterium]|nr:hypothetical protein [candidate division TA06 bacterium]